MDEINKMATGEEPQPEIETRDNANTAQKAKGKKKKSKDHLETDSVLRAMQIKYNFYKWFLGTFLIGAFTAITTFILKDYQLKIDTRQKESAYLAPYFKSYMSLFQKNTIGYDRTADMAKFLSCAVADKEYKAGWNDLYSYCQRRTGQLKAQNDSITKDNVTKRKTLDSLQVAKSHVLASREVNGSSNAETVKLLKIQESITAVTNQLSLQAAVKQSNLTKIDPITSPPAPAKTEPVTATQQMIEQTKQDYTLVEDTVKYIARKKGQTFNGNFDVTVWDVNVNDQTVNARFSMVSNGYLTTKFKDNVDLKVGDEQTFISPDGAYKFVVKVKQISKSGKSFAFFQVKSYIKT